MAIGPKTLFKARPCLPKSWKLGKLAEQHANSHRYTAELYEDKKAQARLQTGSEDPKTLMISLVRVS